MHWVLMPFRRAFDYSGRSSRTEFFAFILVFWFALPMGVAIGYPAMASGPGAPDGLLIGVAVAMLVLLVPALPLMVRRFHDFGWSGWWLLMLLAPLAGVVAATAILVWVPGHVGPNQYGPDPMASGLRR